MPHKNNNCSYRAEEAKKRAEEAKKKQADDFNNGRISTVLKDTYDRACVLLYNAVGYMLENGMTMDEVADYLCTSPEELLEFNAINEEDMES